MLINIQTWQVHEKNANASKVFYCTQQPKHKKIHTVTQTFCQLNIFSVKKAISFVAVTKMNDPQTELLARGKNGKNIFLVLGNMLWMHISKWHLPLFPASLHQSNSIKLPTVYNISHQNSICNNNEHNIFVVVFSVHKYHTLPELYNSY